MRIVGVDVGGFGRLRGLTLGFGPRIHVIHGRNETGKSTLLEAMQALLFGFADDAGTSPTQKHNALVSHFRPWDGGPFDGALLVALANDDNYRIVRDFERGVSRIYREPGAVDVTETYADPRRDGLSFADVHLDVTRAVFRASAWIDQADIQLGGDDVSTLRDTLERLADSAGTEASAQEALDRLEGLLRERINPRGYLGGRDPILQASEDVERIGSDLVISLRVYGALEGTAVEDRQLAANLAELSEQLRRLEAQLAWRELTDLDDKIFRLAEIDRGLSVTRERLVGLEDVAGLTAAALQAATSALDDVDRLAWVAARTGAVVDDEREAREKDEREAKDLATELDEILDVSDDAIDRAAGVTRSWDEAARAVEKARGQFEESERQLAELAEDDLPSDADLAVIAVTVRAVDNASRRVRDAEEDSADVPVPADLDAEFDGLDRTLRSLTADQFEILQGQERMQELAAARATSAITPLMSAGVLAVVGLTIGFFFFGPIGAGIALVFGGIFGFVLVRVTQPSPGEGVDQDRAFLKSELAVYEVESVAQLRRHWNRRLELGAVVGKARELRQRVALRREALDRALGDLERVVGTRDVERTEAAVQALRDRGARRDRARAQCDEARRTLANLTASMEQARRAAGDVLAGVGLRVEDSANALNQVDLLRFNQRRRLLVLRQQADVEGRRRAYAKHEAVRNDAAEELAMARRTAAEWLAAVGALTQDAGVRSELNSRRDRFEMYQSARDDLRRWEGARNALVGGDDPGEWNRRRIALRERVADADRADTRSLQDLRDAHQEATHRCDETHRSLTELRAHTAARLESVRPPAIIAEELAAAKAKLDGLTRLKRAVEGAISLLTMVADVHRRDFAPRLQQRIRDPLASITSGRYDDVTVDPMDLAVRLRLAGGTDLVPLGQVSHGTRDAVGLLLRAAFVDLLGKPEESVPLFLDDPLVHVDPDRTRRILDVLLRLSEQRQIFFVTQDPRVEEWASAHGECEVSRLDRPS